MAASGHTWLTTLQQLANARNEQEQKQAVTVVARNQASLTVAKAIEAGTQISTLKRQDEQSVIDAVGALITLACHSLNVGKNMTDLQVYTASCTLVERFWYLKLEEFALIFRNGCTGFYGKLFDRVDVEIISSWIEKYWGSDERLGYLAKMDGAKIKKDEGLELLTIQNPELFKNAADKILREKRQMNKADSEKVPTYEVWLNGFKKQLPNMPESDLKRWLKEARKIGNAELENIIIIHLKKINP